MIRDVVGALIVTAGARLMTKRGRQHFFEMILDPEVNR